MNGLGIHTPHYTPIFRYHTHIMQHHPIPFANHHPASFPYTFPYSSICSLYFVTFFLTVSCFLHISPIFSLRTSPYHLPAFPGGILRQNCIQASPALVPDPPQRHRTASPGPLPPAAPSTRGCRWEHLEAILRRFEKIGDALWMIELEQCEFGAEVWSNDVKWIQMAELLQHPATWWEAAGKSLAICPPYSVILPYAPDQSLGLWGARILKRQPSLRSRLWVTVAWMSSAPLTVWARNQGRPKEDSEVCTDLWTSDIFSWFTSILCTTI